MKSLLFASLLFTAPAFAATNATIKTCSTTIVSPDGDKSIPTVFEIIEADGVLRSKYTQTIDGQSVSREDVAEISELTIRAGLSVETNPDGLNLAESLIVHAMTLSAVPEMKGTQTAGIDLESARSAKVYVIGKPTHMGLGAIVEAKDQDGKTLGSFLGGFLVSPCK